VLHYEHPAERGRGVQDEAKIKPTGSQRLLARAGELEEVVTQYADHAEDNGDQHCDCPCSHRQFAICLVAHAKRTHSTAPKEKEISHRWRERALLSLHPS